MQRVHEKKLADPPPFAALIDGEAAEERSRHPGIARKFPGHIGGQALQVNAECRERIVSEDSFRRGWFDNNKGRSDEAARVLARNLFQVTVKDFVAADESRAVVLLAQRLDNPRGFGRSERHLFAGTLFVTARRFAQAGSRGGGFKKRRNEDLPVAVTQSHSLVFPQGAGGGFISAGHNKITERTSEQRGGFGEKILLLFSDARFKTCRPGTLAFRYFMRFHGGRG